MAVGDGALGFWAALRDVWPETRDQRDWVHKLANVLDALHKSAQPTARKMLAEIRDAENRDHAVTAAKRFDAEFRARWPKAADKTQDDLDRLLTFYDFPAEHWLTFRSEWPHRGRPERDFGISGCAGPSRRGTTGRSHGPRC